MLLLHHSNVAIAATLLDSDKYPKCCVKVMKYSWLQYGVGLKHISDIHTFHTMFCTPAMREDSDT